MEGQPTTMNPQAEKEFFLHQLRKEIDACIQKANAAKQDRDSGFGREMSLAHTKLQEAKMWVGKCLEAIDAKFPEELRDEAEAPDTKAETPEPQSAPIENEVNNDQKGGE